MLDIDDDQSDNSAELVLSNKPNILQVSSDLPYSIGAAVLVIGILWLLGLIKPNFESTRPQLQKVKKIKQKKTPKQKTSKVEPKPVEEESTIQIEDDGNDEDIIQDSEELLEMQESLIEVEESEPEPPEEELDEFELRLKKLRESRK